MTVRNIVSAAASFVDVATSDPQFQNTTLLLSGDGTNGAQNNTFLDNSIPGGYGVYYAQAGVSWLRTSTSLSLTGDFTIEFWIKLDTAAVSANTYQGIFSVGDENASGGAGLAVFGYSGAASLYVGNNAATGQSAAKGSLGIWTHVAVVRSGSTVKIALNGDMTGAGVVTGWSATISGNVTIGGEFYNGSVGWAMSRGALSNVRIVNGTALYTANFTPPVAPLTAISGTQLLVCQSSTLFLDNSPLQATNTSTNLVGLSVISPSNYGMTITRNGTPTQGSFSPYGDLWSNNFSGSGQYLSIPDNAGFAYGSGDFTIEGSVFLTSYASADSDGFYRSSIISQDQFAPVNSRGWLFYLQGTSTSFTSLNFTGWSGGSATSVSGSFTFVLNTWYHVAVVRSSNRIYFYVNGTLINAGGTAFAVTINDSSIAPKIGAAVIHNSLNFNWYLPAYLSNLRIVKGTALYTSNFTPSTTPLTAVSGTSLLTCQSNRFKDNSSNNFTITVTGTPTVQRFSPFKPSEEYSTSIIGSSAYFDGSSSLSTPANTALTMGTSDFTVEFWMYATNAADLGTAATIVRIRANAATTWNMQLNSGQMQFYGGGAAAGDPSSIPLNTWIHFAGVRTGGNLFSLYRNGVLVSTLSSTVNLTASDTFLIGVGGDSSDTAYPFYGYIADLRIVKGTALYTSNFTPSTTPLAPTINTSLLMNYSNAGIYDSTMMNDLATVDNTQISAMVKKYGTGSLYFDGTNDYLQIAEQGLFDFGTSDFTVEAWINMSAFTNDKGSVMADLGPTNGGWMLAVRSATQVSWGQSQISWDVSTSGFTMSTGTWYHIAVCRSGTSLKIFINGTAYATATNSTAYNMINSFVGIGARQLTGSTFGPGEYFNGYIDDLRVTKGYARYTTNFTPPTSALLKR